MADGNVGGNGQVAMNIEDIVKMMAKDVAREVVDRLLVTDIEPLRHRIGEAEYDIEQLKMDSSNSATRNKTALDTLWKVAVIVAGIFSMIMKAYPHLFEH